MDEPRPRHAQVDRVATDLVEYFVVAVPGVESLGELGPALSELVHRAAIRILDLVIVVKDGDGTRARVDLDAVDSLVELQMLDDYIGGLLSDHDIELAASAIDAGTTGIVVVTEDRWAEPLSAAARRAGGQIIAGDRIPASRIATVLAERHPPQVTDREDVRPSNAT